MLSLENSQGNSRKAIPSCLRHLGEQRLSVHVSGHQRASCWTAEPRAGAPAFAELSSPVFPRATAAGSFQGVATPPSNASTLWFLIPAAPKTTPFLHEKKLRPRRKTSWQGAFHKTPQIPNTPNQYPPSRPFLFAVRTTMEDYKSQRGLRPSARAEANGRRLPDRRRLIRARLAEALSGSAARQPRPRPRRRRAPPSPLRPRPALAVLPLAACQPRRADSLLQPPATSQPTALSSGEEITDFLAPYTLLKRAKFLNLNHEGNRAHPGGSVWQPDWCQGKDFKPLLALFLSEKKKNPDKLCRMVVGCLPSPALANLCQKEILYV